MQNTKLLDILTCGVKLSDISHNNNLLNGSTNNLKEAITRFKNGEKPEFQLEYIDIIIRTLHSIHKSTERNLNKIEKIIGLIEI